LRRRKTKRAGKIAETIPGPSSSRQIPIERINPMLLAFISLTVALAALVTYGIFCLVMETLISEGVGK
jgi:hypothetical protein